MCVPTPEEVRSNEPGKIVREECFREISCKRVEKPVILRKIIGHSGKL